MNTAMMMSPIGPTAMLWFSWPAHCALMLVSSALSTALSVKIVRKVALRQATGQLDLLPKRRLAGAQQKKSAKRSRKSQERYGIIRPVKGSPVLWKEIRAPMIRGVDSRNSLIGLVITIIALFITYGVCKRTNCLNESFVHVTYVIMFVFIGAIFTMVLSATCITSEKESSAWPIMLATSMDDWQILLGKAGGVFRRCLPIWLLLTGHVLLFVCLRYIHPILIVHLFIFVTGLVAFLTGVGIYFSSRFKRTTSAVVATFGVAIALWVVVPSVLAFASEISKDKDLQYAFSLYFSGNPAVQTGVVTSTAGGDAAARMKLLRLRYAWPHHGRWRSAGDATLALLGYMLIHASIGVLLAWRAKRRFRRNVF